MSSSPTPLENAAHFLSIANQFRLGELPTEGCHPLTKDLSNLSRTNLPKAIGILKEVELLALDSIDARKDDLAQLTKDVESTLSSGGRVFFCGCGATGRLSLSIETIWRQVCKEKKNGRENEVASFIAGGDYALVRSIENFEDHPEYGAQQLSDLGFGANDLLIATTEGGETPFVIGATEEATLISKRAPWFLYCNPNESLMSVERSKRVIENPKIRCVSFATGPMAIAGSTRLQASTVLMLTAGAALFAALGEMTTFEQIDLFKNSLKEQDFGHLDEIIEIEAGTYALGSRCLHITDDYGICVLTDTTERSPTFSLVPFENALEAAPRFAWTYLAIEGAEDSHQAWQRILHRDSRPLGWPGFAHRYGMEVLEGFDFSMKAVARRKQLPGDAPQIFSVLSRGDFIELALGGKKAKIKKPGSLLCEHLLLKCALNICSTLVMGRVGRFSGNLMLFVKASNNKLVDRSIRFTRQLMEDAGLPPATYEDVCYAIFETSSEVGPEEPVVLKTFERLRARS